MDGIQSFLDGRLKLAVGHDGTVEDLYYTSPAVPEDPTRLEMDLAAAAAQCWEAVRQRAVPSLMCAANVTTLGAWACSIEPFACAGGQIRGSGRDCRPESRGHGRIRVASAIGRVGRG